MHIGQVACFKMLPSKVTLVKGMSQLCEKYYPERIQMGYPLNQTESGDEFIS